LRRLIPLLLFLSGVGFCQSTPQNSSLILTAPTPPIVTGIGASVTSGNGGINQYFYWVVAVYPIGRSAISNYAQLNNVPNTGSVTIGWNQANGATGYDILRTTTNTIPNPATCNCTLSINQSPLLLSYIDTLGSTTSYASITNFTSPARWEQDLNNRDYSTPTLVDGTLNINRVYNGSLQTQNLPYYVGSYGKVGTNDDSATITAAIAAVPDGGELWLYPGVSNVCTQLPFILTKRITIKGFGWGSVLQVCSTASGTTDVFLIKPPSANAVQGFKFEDFYITPISGTPGRSGFMIDGTNGPVSNLVIDHVYVGQLGSYAFNIQNASGLTTGTPFTTTIRGESVLTGGANFTNAGDNVSIIEGTVITGTGSILVNVIGAAGASQGAHGFLLNNVNITVAGGIVIQNATQFTMRDSNLEATIASTEANNCLIDIQGTGTANVANVLIDHSFLGANSIYVGCAVRVDKANNVMLSNNYIIQGSVNAVTTTANANRTSLLFNLHAPANPISSWLSDSGATTWGLEYNAAGLPVFYGAAVGFSTTTGTNGTSMTSARFEVNPTNGAFCGTSGDPTSTGCNVFMSPGGANTWTFGNAFGDSSALLAFGTARVNLFQTQTNCASNASPAVCGSAASGAVAIPTGVSSVTLQVNTTAVTANSRIMLLSDDSLTIASTTCNSTLATLVGGLAVTARNPGVSFTVTYNATIATNPLCISYNIIN
jgi:hypothetical protein